MAESNAAKTPEKSLYYKKQRLESRNSNHKKLLSRRYSSPILTTVVKENCNNTNEKKYKTHI